MAKEREILGTHLFCDSSTRQKNFFYFLRHFKLCFIFSFLILYLPYAILYLISLFYFFLILLFTLLDFYCIVQMPSWETFHCFPLQNKSSLIVALVADVFCQTCLCVRVYVHAHTFLCTWIFHLHEQSNMWVDRWMSLSRVIFHDFQIVSKIADFTVSETHELWALTTQLAWMESPHKLKGDTPLSVTREPVLCKKSQKT